MCEQHLIQSYRETTEFLRTREAATIQAVPHRPQQFKFLGMPFGICPACTHTALARDEVTGDVRCIWEACEFTATASDFCDLCDERVREMAAECEMVYYIRFGDRVKIGTTKNLRQRLTVIPHDEVMATEPGGPHVERQRHKQFAHLRVHKGAHREWFTLKPELADHIAAVRAREDVAAAPHSAAR